MDDETCYTGGVMSTLVTNRDARFSYELLEEFEAGIALTGPEVKSAKLGQVNLRGSYVSVRLDGLYLVNCHISPYKPAKAAQTGYQPNRDRRLLVHKGESARFIGQQLTPGLTLIPVSLYTKGSLIKVKIALGRGKKKYDKRESIKRREIDRRIRRVVRD